MNKSIYYLEFHYTVKVDGENRNRIYRFLIVSKNLDCAIEDAIKDINEVEKPLNRPILHSYLSMSVDEVINESKQREDTATQFDSLIKKL